MLRFESLTAQHPTLQGRLMYPPPPPKVDPGALAAKETQEVVKKEPPPPPNYFNITLKDSLMYTTGLSGAIGMFCLLVVCACFRCTFVSFKKGFIFVVVVFRYIL